MPISCKPILVNNTPCNCVTAVTSAGLYGVASPLYPTTASLNALHTVQYDDRIVMYKRTATGWIEVQNYSLGSSDTDTRIEFNQVLPSGEWEWEIRDVIANTVLSTFTTPAIVANTVSSPNGTVDVNLNANDYELEVTHTTNPDGSITLNDGTIVPAPVILGAAWDSSAIPPADGDLVIVDNGYLVLPIPNEERICLNTGAPFLVADPNNPTIAEVEAWATVNLTLQQRENGTQLVYFVTGDGGSCDVPDYEWTLNKGSQLVTLSNKRVFNTKTVYVDAGSGSDVTGRRGYREFPFKTLNEGITAALEGDLLYVFPGDYIQSTPITRWINIHCESGVDWLLQSNFSAATDFALAKTVNWKFDVIRQVSHDQYQCRPLNTLGGYNLVANKIENILLFAATKYRSVKVSNSVNSSLGVNSLGAINPQGTSEVDNAEWDYTKGAIRPLFLSENSDNPQLNFYCRNLTAINSNVGSLRPVIGYYFASDIGTNKNIKTKVDNISFTDPNIYSTPAGTLAGSIAWRGTTPGVHAGMLSSIADALRNNSVFEFEFGNVKASGHGFCINGTNNFDNCYVKVKITGLFTKGIPAYTARLANVTNSTIIFDLDLIADTAMGLVLGFGDGVNVLNNIHPSNTIIVTGRIKTRQSGYPCISIGQGTAASNNTNGTILLKDLTLINDGTVSPIMCAVQENVVIQNVKTNSLITDVNIVEVAESITRNSNYK